MAERRMFAKTIIDSDAFIDMPVTARLLYYDLGMRADDDGIINSPKKIIRMIGASEDDLKILLAKKFVMPFESGIVVIKHWKINNSIRKDRYNQTKYIEELNMLNIDDNGAYQFAQDTKCIQYDNQTTTTGIPSGNHVVGEWDTQVRLGKDRLGKVRLDKSSKGENEDSDKQNPTPRKKKKSNLKVLEDLKNNQDEYLIKLETIPNLMDSVNEWLKYKDSRKESYTEIGLKQLIKKIYKNSQEYGIGQMIDLIEECMANEYKGIIYDRLTRPGLSTKSTSGGYDWDNL